MGAIKKSVQIRKLWRSCQTQLELSKIFRFWSRATRDFEQQTIFLVVLWQQKIWRQLNSNEWHLNLRLFPQNPERNFFEQIVPLQTLDIQKIYLCRAASRDPIFQLWKWNLLTKNTEFHIRTNVFSITDLYLRVFFLKGFHDGFDGDSPLISGNTEFAMKFRCPWRSINWSFCYFHSLLLWWAHWTRVLHVWQPELNWCKHLAKAYHCELVNTGRGAAWGMGKRVEREDVSFLFLVSLEGA